MPGIADESEGAMQHAPQPDRQAIFFMGTILCHPERSEGSGIGMNVQILRVRSE
jgi:hypothetical protein